MESAGSHTQATALGALNTLRRHKWIVILTTVAVAGVSIFLAMQQTAQYQASAAVLLKFQNLASGLTGIQDLSTVYQDPARIAATQTEIAMSPAVGERVARRAGIPGLTAGGFLGHASVTAEPTSDVLDFQVTYTDPQDRDAARDAPREAVHRAPAPARHGITRRGTHPAPGPDRGAEQRQVP